MSYEEKAQVNPKEPVASAVGTVDNVEGQKGNKLSKSEERMCNRIIEEIQSVGLEHIKKEVSSGGGVYIIKASSGMLRIGYDKTGDALFLIGFDGPDDKPLARFIGDRVGIKSLRGGIYK
ncbi:MAG: hypothetical protein WC797_00180 [Candidatus Paceibacterota bacterium]|jgi:hypothetical protein